MPAFQAGYLAAAWAELEDPDDPQVGFVGGMSIPSVEQFITGYTSGSEFYNEQKGAQVLVKGDYAGTFTDPDMGAAVATALLDEGVDVIFAAAGTTGNGALAVAKKQGKWGIGVDQDQYLTLPEVQGILLTSVMKRTDNAVFQVVEMLVQGEFPGGTIHNGTLENGGVGLAPFHNYQDQIPDSLQKELEKIRAGIIGGDIAIGR
jgi:basic membrane protein A